MNIPKFLFFFFSMSLYGQTDTTQLIDQFFSQYNSATPGASILVARGARLLYHKAFGLADLEHNVPNTVETVFECGSVSKQFTATSILVLARDGKLSLQDDVRKFIPELPVYDAPIIVHHLLNHTSGLKDWGSVGELTGWPRTTRAYTNALALHIITKQKSLNFTPGTEYSYSNSNYTLLGAIVERLSKKTLARFTDSVFFKPLNMTSTQWRDNFREIVPNRAVAYSKSGANYQQLMPFEHVHGHGGLLTTTSDLLKWNQLLNDPKLLGNQVAAWRVEKGKLKNGKSISYASGIVVDEANHQIEIAHSGATAGYRAWLAYYPQKKISIILLSNDAHFNLGRAAHGIAEIYLGKSAEYKKTSPAFVSLTDNEKKNWVGYFKSVRGFDDYPIALTTGKLMDYKGSELQAISRDTLLNDDAEKIVLKPGRGLMFQNSLGDTASYKKVGAPDVSAKSIKSLAGLYQSVEADASFEVTVSGTEATLSHEPLLQIKLIPAFRDAFTADNGMLHEFERNKKGEVILLYISQGRAERVPFVKVK